MNVLSFLLSPSLLYIAVWTVTIWLQSLRILNFYKPINWDFIKIQVLVCAIILISEFVIKATYQTFPQSTEKKPEKLEGLYSFCRMLLPLLITMFVIDILWSGGVPLFWLISGSKLTHSDFGIPSFHGAFHGILLFFVTASFFLFLQGVHKKESLVHVMFFFFYACLAFNRGITFIFIVQALFIYLVTYNKKIKLRSVVFLILSSLVFIWIFGILGDFRTGYNTFAKNITSEWKDFFSFCPQSFLWFYNYGTTGLNNLYGNIPNVHPEYYPFYTFSRLVPTVFYKLLGIPQISAFSLMDQRATISTAFEGLVSDFGVIGVLFYLPVIFFAQINYYKALKNPFFSIIMYSVLMQTIIMTVFIDTLFYLPFLLQMFILFCINYQETIIWLFKKYVSRLVKHETGRNHAKN